MNRVSQSEEVPMTLVTYDSTDRTMSWWIVFVSIPSPIDQEQVKYSYSLGNNRFIKSVHSCLQINRALQVEFILRSYVSKHVHIHHITKHKSGASCI